MASDHIDLYKYLQVIQPIVGDNLGLWVDKCMLKSKLILQVIMYSIFTIWYLHELRLCTSVFVNWQWFYNSGVIVIALNSVYVIIIAFNIWYKFDS